MIKHITYAATALSLLAGPATALSCQAPNAVAAYNFVAEAEESFVILRGEFDFDPKKVPDVNGPAVPVSLATAFKGKLLTGDGFTDEVEVPVTLTLGCIGPWCARVSPKTDYMAFVLQTDDRLIFRVEPCYQFAFANPSDEAIAQIEQCAAGGDCTPE